MRSQSSAEASAALDLAGLLLDGFCLPDLARALLRQPHAARPWMLARLRRRLTSSLMPGAPPVRQAVDPGGANATAREEVIRFAESLDDYDHVSVTDMGGNGPIDHWLVVTDHRFDLSYEIASHADYWDFIAALVGHHRCIAVKEVA